MKITAEPRSDQWNADDFIGGPRTFTIAGVKVGAAEQKYDIDLAEGDGRVWRPPLTMLRMLITAWGDDATAWTGRRVTLYRDPSIRFGADAVGGIRISHLSHINKPLTVSLTESRGKRKPHRVEPLPDRPAATDEPSAPDGDRITAPQLQKLAILRQTEGYEDDENGRADWFAMVTNAVGRQINGSNKELTKGEASKLIDVLETAQQASDK